MIIQPSQFEKLKKRISQRSLVDTNGCWLWTGTLDRCGYGQIGVQGKTWFAHRASYTVHRSPIPAGLDLDHECRVRNCVNPFHLRPIARVENVMIGNGPCAINARKTVCKNGHPFDQSNTIANGKGRKCKICARAAVDRYQGKRKKFN